MVRQLGVSLFYAEQQNITRTRGGEASQPADALWRGRLCRQQLLVDRGNVDIGDDRCRLDHRTIIKLHALHLPVTYKDLRNRR